jgi:hypothetical protein
MSLIIYNLNFIINLDFSLDYLFYSSILVQHKKINPYFITGLTDGDGSFYFSISDSNYNRTNKNDPEVTNNNK